MVALFTLLTACLCTPLASADQGTQPLRNVLVLFPEESWSTPTYRTIYDAIKSVFDLSPGADVELFGDGLDLHLFPDETGQEFLADFLTHKYGRMKIDLVVPVAPSSLGFVMRTRHRLFRDAPVVYCGLIPHGSRPLELRSDVTGTGLTLDVAGTIEVARTLRPGLKRIAVVAGTGMIDQHLLSVFRDAFRQYAGVLELIDLTSLPLELLLESVTGLPESTAIYYAGIQRDGAGRVYSSAAVQKRVSQVANAPLFSTIDTALGYGSVGGRMTQIGLMGQITGEIVLRVLAGEDIATIAPVVVSANPAIFDWRELKRWGIDEDALPPGSIVRFRHPSLWEKYRWWIVGASVFVCGLLLLVFMLGSNLVRRRRAERDAAQMRQNMAHVARVSTVGQLGQTIAHEINQPLAAIRMNAETAAQLLTERPPDMEEVRAALGDIVADSRRVQEVVASLRSLVRNRPAERIRLGLNPVATDAVKVMRALAESKGVEIRLELESGLPPVEGDRVQLQQVVLNLVLNAVEAVNEYPGNPGSVTVRTARAAGGGVELSVTDTGPGIDPETARHLFSPFFSTKPEGLGLGLSICRTIAEAHGGSFGLAPGRERGAEFVLRLPAAPERRREPRSERREQ